MLRAIVILTLTCSAIMLPRQAQEPWVEFRLSTEESIYFVYEPVSLTMTVTNQGEQPIQGNFDLINFNARELELFYRKKGDTFKRYHNWTVWWAISTSGVRVTVPTLDPGQQFISKEMVLYDINPGSYDKKGKMVEGQFVLDEPGEYEFKATYYYLAAAAGVKEEADRSKTIESNVHSITVVSPTEEEQEALAQWKNKDMALVVQGDGWDPVGGSQLSAFLRDFPTSRYAMAVKSAPGRLLQYMAKREGEKKLTEEEKRLYKLLEPKN